MARQTVTVVGGGLAGLSATMKLAELGCKVNLVSVVPVKRSHSVCAQGGINSVSDMTGEDDSIELHAYDTIRGGDFLADQPPVYEMCYNAPYILKMLDHIGVPFNRTASGNLDRRRFGGTLYNRTAFCGASTGQQLLYGLDEQVRRAEAKGLVQKYENHEFMRVVQNQDGEACGIVMMDIYTLDLTVLKSDAVIFATGGNGIIFGKSTNSMHNTGAAAARLFVQSGALLANSEFIQVHPTAIPGKDKYRLMSESARGEGGRVWVWGNSAKRMKNPADGELITCGVTGEKWFFLEAFYPGYGNLVARDVASRAILAVTDAGLGVDGKDQVYLDVTHLEPKTQDKLEAILDIYQKYTGEDPRIVPMKIFPAVHYTMGGLYIDWPAYDAEDRLSRFRQMTNIKGVFAAGECEYQYHGANRLGANSLLSCIYGGLVAGAECERYMQSLGKDVLSGSDGAFEEAQAKELAFKQDLFSRGGEENVHLLHEELGKVMIDKVTVRRSNSGLDEALQKLYQIRERYKHIGLSDKGNYVNQTYIFANQFKYIIENAIAIAKAARCRDESRGAHAKEGFEDRDDENWLKTSIIRYQKDLDPHISYNSVDTRYFKPVKRDYTKAVKKKIQVENPPAYVPIVTSRDYGR
ncbi:MAG: succinate dehydrogenase flavoprotein subunit [Chlamydiae bacterium]|nr:succinate dehydrogenase flavoprotein subunit [Chlamydiota bacterium]